MKSVLLLAALVFSTAASAAEPANPHAGMAMPHAVALSRQAVVVSNIDVPEYTYLEVREGKNTLWLAAASIKVKKGDTVRFDNGMVMNNFNSKTLKRTFPSITFVNRAEVAKTK